MVQQNKNTVYSDIHGEALIVTPHPQHIGDIMLKATLEETYGPDYQEKRGLSVVPAQQAAEVESTEIPNAS